MTSVIKEIKNNENNEYNKYYLEEKCYYGKNCRGFRSGKCPYNHYDLRGVIKSNVKKLPYGFCKFECLDPTKNIRCKRKVCSFDHLKGKIKFVNGTDKIKIVESKGTSTEDINIKEKENEKKNTKLKIEEKKDVVKKENIKEEKKDDSKIEKKKDDSKIERKKDNSKIEKKKDDSKIEKKIDEIVKELNKDEKKDDLKMKKKKKEFKKKSKYTNKNRSKYKENFKFSGSLKLDEKSLSSI